MAEKKTVKSPFAKASGDKKETKTAKTASPFAKATGDKKVDNAALTRDALESRLTDLKKEAMNQRFQHTAGQMPKTHVIRKTRREIARVKTALRAA